MKLAFDAKRALNNFTGLGNHARILLNAMIRDFPDNEFLLYSPKAKDVLVTELHGDFKIMLPACAIINKGGVWRSWGVTKQLLNKQVNLYHGLSNELPFNIHRTSIKTVVTIHDLIFLKHTEQYPFIDRQIYELKTRYAAKHAHKIIAVSEETKADLIHFYKTPSEKIEVIYPSVDVSFQNGVVSDKPLPYQLPAKFILNVGSFFPRKNQKTLIEAFDLVKDKIAEDLVLVGSDGSIKQEIESFIKSKNLNGRVHIIAGISNADLPAVYRMASLFVFPSLYEGFGAPVLEALFSEVPVIASKGGAIEEAGGKDSLFVKPTNAQELAEAMLKVLTNDALKKQMTAAGQIHAQSMTDKMFALKVMAVYKDVLGKQSI